MRYDFTTLPIRNNTSAEKYRNMYRINPNVPGDIVPFSVADMDFLPIPELCRGLSDYIDHNVMGYTLPPDDYYDAVISWYRTHHGIEITRDSLTAVDNVIDALRQEIRCFSEPDDEVLVLTPAYPAFLSSVKATGRSLLEVPFRCEDGKYTFDFDQVEKACSDPKASILLLANPANPIGRVCTREELMRLSEICLRHNVFIISDEIHWDLILPPYQHCSMASLPDPYRRNCSVNTAATKSFNMPAIKGAEILIADEEKRKVFRDYMDAEGIPGRSILSYVATKIGYTCCEGWLTEAIDTIDRNRQLMEEYFKDKIPQAVLSPLEGTYLQWIDFRFLGLSGRELEQFMQQKAYCFFTDGYKFGQGGEGYERWNIACPQDVLLSGMERLYRALQEKC